MGNKYEVNVQTPGNESPRCLAGFHVLHHGAKTKSMAYSFRVTMNPVAVVSYCLTHCFR